MRSDRCLYEEWERKNFLSAAIAAVMSFFPSMSFWLLFTTPTYPGRNRREPFTIHSELLRNSQKTRSNFIHHFLEFLNVRGPNGYLKCRYYGLVSEQTWLVLDFCLSLTSQTQNEKGIQQLTAEKTVLNIVQPHFKETEGKIRDEGWMEERNAGKEEGEGVT